MLISWVKKTTLLDYPWKIAAIVFTLGCNFRCHYCHNYEFVLPENVAAFKNDLIPEEAFFNFLKSRIWFLDWVVISWWEPTIHKDIESFISKIKGLWYLVKLDTNWRDPDLIKRLIENKLVDYIAMDIKYVFSEYRKMTWVDEDGLIYQKSKQIIMDSKIDYEFRTTISDPYFNEDVISRIWEDIRWAKKWYLQNFEEKNILNSWFDGRSFEISRLNELKNIWDKYVSSCQIRK